MSLELILLIIVSILAIVGIFVARKIGKMKEYVQLLVASAEMVYSKIENTEKYNSVLNKFEAKFPIVTKILGRYWSKKAIHAAIDKMQELIGSTSDRNSTISSQLEKMAYDYAKDEVSNKVNELKKNLLQRDFFGNQELCSNEQVKEESNKILSVGISPNFEKLKKSVVDLKFGYKF